MKNCYKQHGREDLLYAFEDQQTQQQTTTTHSIAHLVPSQTVVQTFSNPDGTVSLIQVSEILISSALHWALSSSSLSAWNSGCSASRRGLPGAEQRGEEPPCPAGHALCNEPQGTIGLLGYWGTLLTCGQLLINHWSNVSQPRQH